MINTQGIILKSEDFREADRRLSFYTADFGKMIVLARGARKIKSKLAGHLLPFSILDISLARGKNFDHLTGVTINKILLPFLSAGEQAEDLPPHQNFWCGGLQKILLAQHLLERVDELTKEDKPDKKIFQLILAFLSELSKNRGSNLFLADAFVLKLLSFLGYQPHLFCCVQCQRKKIKPPIFFSIKDGGIICSSCQKNINGGSGASTIWEISKETLGLLQMFLTKKLSFFRRSDLQKNSAEQAHQVVSDFLNWHL